MPPIRRNQAMVALLFLAGVALTLAVLDRHLAGRVGATLDLAAIALGEAGGGGADRFDLPGVEADLCNALTGGIWFAWILPRTRVAAGHNPFHVEAVGGRCQRTRRGNTLVFRRG
jgi:hypothetical protein